jgi:hypothetical protein
MNSIPIIQMGPKRIKSLQQKSLGKNVRTISTGQAWLHTSVARRKKEKPLELRSAKIVPVSIDIELGSVRKRKKKTISISAKTPCLVSKQQTYPTQQSPQTPQLRQCG